MAFDKQPPSGGGPMDPDDPNVIDMTDLAQEITDEDEKSKSEKPISTDGQKREIPQLNDDVPSLEALMDMSRNLRQSAKQEEPVELAADDFEMLDENDVVVNEIPKSYDVTGSVVKRESIDGRKMSIIGTNKKERGSKDVVEDAVVMNLETGIFALGDSHEVKGVPGSGVEAAKDFTRLFSEFQGVSKETLSTGSEEQIKEEFVQALLPVSENFAAKQKEITCSLVQMHENPDGTRTAVVYNVGDSMILKANKETGAVERVGQFDQAGEELFEMFVRSTDNDDLWSMDHPMINKLKEEGADKLVQYFKGINYQETFDYFKCAEIIAKDSSLSDIEKQDYRGILDVLNAKMSKTFEKKNVTADRVEVLHLKPGEVLLEFSDGIIDNVDVRGPEFINAVKGGSAGIEIFLDSTMSSARKKDDFSINVIG
jgi:hypothetical protein